VESSNSTQSVMGWEKSVETSRIGSYPCSGEPPQVTDPPSSVPPELRPGQYRQAVGSLGRTMPELAHARHAMRFAREARRARVHSPLGGSHGTSRPARAKETASTLDR
jgi:hypothetical protein